MMMCVWRWCAQTSTSPIITRIIMKIKIESKKQCLFLLLSSDVSVPACMQFNQCKGGVWRTRRRRHIRIHSRRELEAQVFRCCCLRFSTFGMLMVKRAKYVIITAKTTTTTIIIIIIRNSLHISAKPRRALIRSDCLECGLEHRIFVRSDAVFYFVKHILLFALCFRYYSFLLWEFVETVHFSKKLAGAAAPLLFTSL